VVAGTTGRPRVDVDAFAVLLGPALDRVVAKPGQLYRFQQDAGSADYHALGQTLTVGRSGWLDIVDLPLSRESWTTADLVVELHDGDPTGPLLASASIPSSAIPVHPSSSWIAIAFDLPPYVKASQHIAITTQLPDPLPGGVPAGPAWYWAWSNAGGARPEDSGGGVAWGGSRFGDPVNGSHWSDGSALAFRTWISPEVAPRVVAFQPAGGGPAVPASDTFHVRFNEPVTADATSFTVECTLSGSHEVTVAADVAAQNWTIDPVVDLTPGETCVVTVVAGAVHDADSVDPPDLLASDAVVVVSVAPSR